MTTYAWEKLNNKPLPIEYLPDEHDDAKDFEPSFWWNNRRYYVCEFIRCHNNPWMGCSEFPKFIHGMEADEYIRPLFIQLVGENEHDDDYVMTYTDGSAEFINVYEEHVFELLDE